MRRTAIVGLCLLAGLLVAPALPTASAAPAEIAVSGTGVGMYPTFDPDVLRYAVTTTEGTGGAVTVTAPAGSSINGVPVTGPVSVTGLTEGEEIAVRVDSSSYAFVYLPHDFPALTVTTHEAGVAPGYIGLGLTSFGPGPTFETLIDRHGVPAWLRRGPSSDFKRQPNGDLTTFRPTAAPDLSGSDLVTLDEQFREVGRQHVVGDLTDTDNHDAQRFDDGSTILIGYEPRDEADTKFLDATIQKVDASGQVLFQWNSKDHVDPLVETLNPLLWPMNSTDQRVDYAHINSVEQTPDDTGDLIVSFRHLSAVYRIATSARDGLAPGDVVWRLGGRHSDFDFVDDPDEGPCAQHTAQMLANGNVVVFDNGSGALGQSAAGCVDPNDPLGPGIERWRTRIAEWSLDTTAHTATLEWSYQPVISDPTPRAPFAFFAGSSRRLDNGNTLIGWADERAILASEVALDKTLLWSVQTPDTGVHVTRYATYRASLIDYPDAIDPTVTLDVPPGAVYVDDEEIVPHWSCTDRGGSNLATCTTTGLVDGHLATTPGTHALSVTATDGAGNATTLTRSYLVAGAFLPDGLIRKDGSNDWKGGNVYGPATGQTVRQRTQRRHTATTRWRVQNDGERADAFRLLGAGSSARFRVRYFAGGNDVTAAVVAGTHRTATLAPGAWTTLRVEVTPKRRARVGDQRTVKLRATSVASATVNDRVATRVTARR